MEEEQVISVMGDTGLYQLVYVSVATEPFCATQLSKLAQACKSFNDANAITGTLIYCEGVFVQWLEGEASVLRPLWHRISRDTRHHCVVELLHTHNVETPLFSEWQLFSGSIYREELLDMVASTIDHPNADHRWKGAIGRMQLLLSELLPPKAQSPG